MRVSTVIGCALGAFSAVALLAGRSDGSSHMRSALLGQAPRTVSQIIQRQAMQNGPLYNYSVLAPHSARPNVHPARTPSFFRKDAMDKPLIFITDGDSMAVDIFLQGGSNQYVGQITGFTFPAGLATDRSGNLYVANETGLGIPVFAPPYTKGPKLTLYPFGKAASIAVSTTGLVGAANYCTLPGCLGDTGNVTFYTKNQINPCAAVYNRAAFAQVVSDAFDGHGNLYVAGLTPGGQTVIGEISGDCNAKTIVPLTTTNTIAYPGSIQIDRAGRIAIEDESGLMIDTYNAPKKGSLGNPISMTPLGGVSAPLAFAFLASGADLYAADAGSGFAYEYAYPAGGAPKKTILVNRAIGVAVTPPLVP